MKYPALITPLLFLTVAIALDPPTKLWEKEYEFWLDSGCHFNDIELTPDGKLFITECSTDFQAPDSLGRCGFLIDQNGDVIWTVDFDCYYLYGWDGVVLPDGSFAITGHSTSPPRLLSRALSDEDRPGR